MSFFKKEDFKGTYNNYQNEWLEKMAELANAKLEREGKVVYTHSTFEKPGYWGPIEQGSFDDTHKALLINIEPIEKCKHINISPRVIIDDFKNFFNKYKDEPGYKMFETIPTEKPKWYQFRKQLSRGLVSLAKKINPDCDYVTGYFMDQLLKSQMDLMTYGKSEIRIEHVPYKETLK